MRTLQKVLFVLCALFSFSFADLEINDLGSYEDVIEEAVEAELLPSPDVSTATVFPKYLDARLPIGKEVEILTVLKNKGELALTVTSIKASFNYPLDHKYYIQNFTEFPYALTVAPSEEYTISYVFQPDALLEPRDYDLVVQMFYGDAEGQNYTSVVFNSTIDMVEVGTAVDAQTFFVYLGVVAVLGLVLFMIYKALGHWRESNKNVALERGTKMNTELNNEWLQGTFADPSVNRKKGRNSSKKKKN